MDTASYANIRRMILAGKKPPEDAVRIEEMVNYFKYDYPAPEAGKPLSVTTQLAPCPWNDKSQILLIGLQAQRVARSKMPPSNLVFLIDVSGSMEAANKLPLVKRAFLLLAENISERDKISIVTYASNDAVVIDGADGSEKTGIMTAIENLEAGGVTHGSKGIETAYELAQKHFIKGGNNRVILATDGELNVRATSEGELTRLIEEKKKKGVFLSVMGFGEGNIKDNKMEALADHGDGNYSYIDTIDEARKVLIEEMGGTLLTIAKDVKLQVEFNPAVVKGYRLMGYENRLMNPEDFNDDEKDGGEPGAGHRVTALYEIVKNDSDFEIPEVESKYNKGKTDGSGEKGGDSGSDENGGTSGTQDAMQNEWLTLNIRYKEPDGEKSKLLSYAVDDSMYKEDMSEDMSFAAGVAQAGMILRDSKYKGTSDIEGLIERLSKLKST